ncbi:DUF1801 domain-containing protein [Chitinophaga sp. RCC_12]|uniref:DUF1801 domain-containing protein n=1 Tax=unclassified Chitinophaga TaxID=2619133 RepID=UPI003525432A
MIRDIDIWYESQPEPAKGCLLALRAYIRQYNPHITEAWKYRMPFFCYNGKMCCYLWIQKENKHPYLGIVEGKNIPHPQLQQDKRARMKILPLNPSEDLPMEVINDILGKMVRWYEQSRK